jgi:hypothetical protein
LCARHETCVCSIETAIHALAYAGLWPNCRG